MPRRLRLLAWVGMPAQAAVDAIAERLGVALETTRVSSNEALQNEFATNEYDLICPSDYLVERLVRDDRLVTLDHGQLPNISNLAAWAFEQDYDPGCRHSVPLAFGTTGFLTRLMRRGGRSWMELFKPRPREVVGMLGEVREVVGAALLACGYSLNDASDGALKDARGLLLEQTPLVRLYSSDDFITPVREHWVVAQHAWSSPGYVAVREDADVNYVVPLEGATLWVTTGGIAAASPDIDLAHSALDLLLTDEMAARTAVSSGFATPNARARAVLATDLRDDPTLYPSADVLRRCEVVRDIGASELAMLDVWREILSRHASVDGGV